MNKIGDEVDGHCPRCKLNTYQIVAATDGHTILSVTCRTCRNSFPWRAEVTVDAMRMKAIKKLQQLQRSRMAGPPEVSSRGQRKRGDFDASLKALEALNGPALAAEVRSRLAAGAVSPPGSSAAAADAAKGTAATAAGAERWRSLTANLGWRDGKPYQVTRTYGIGDVLLHKAHGLGVVEQVVHAQACLVLFRDAETVLQMALPPSAVDR